MRRTPLALLVATAALAACSSSTSNTGPAPSLDAPGSPSDATPPRGDAGPIDGPPIDSMPPPATVIAVACPASPALSVDAPDNGMRYVLTPSNGRLSIGGIAKFTMHKDHNVIPSRTSAMTDPGLNVSFNETKCLMFTRAGTFKFECSPHGFEGTIVVQ